MIDCKLEGECLVNDAHTALCELDEFNRGNYSRTVDFWVDEEKAAKKGLSYYTESQARDTIRKIEKEFE